MSSVSKFTRIVAQRKNDELLFVGGDFTRYRTIPTNRAAKLSDTAVYDSGFISGEGFNNTV